MTKTKCFVIIMSLQYSHFGFAYETLSDDQITRNCNAVYNMNTDDTRFRRCKAKLEWCDGMYGGTDQENEVIKCQMESLGGFQEEKRGTEVAAESDPAEAETTKNSCVETTKSARNFCQDPIGETMKSAGVDDGGGAAAIQIVGKSLMANMAGTGINAVCSLMQTGGNSTAAIDAGFGAKCASMVRDCETACGEAKKLSPKDADVAKNLTTCTQQKAAVYQYGQSAAASLNAARYGELCKQASASLMKSNRMPPANQGAGDTNCSNPINANNPLCKSVTVDGSGSGGVRISGSGSSSSGSQAGKFSNDDFNTGDLDGAFAGQTTGGGATAENKNGGVPNGGGQMLGGSGGGLNGGAGDDKNRGPAAAKTSADVLQGERGGGGYSAGGGFNPGGGWSGYGQADGGSKGGGFDLSRFLPGQKNAPLRGPAGLGRPSAEIAPVYDNIFKKISDRVQVVCKTNRLMDCN